MLDKQKTALWLQHPTHLFQRAADVWDAAHGPGRDNCIDRVVVQRNAFGRGRRCEQACRAASSSLTSTRRQ